MGDAQDSDLSGAYGAMFVDLRARSIERCWVNICVLPVDLL